MKSSMSSSQQQLKQLLQVNPEVYSDYLRDQGDDVAADRWQLLAAIEPAIGRALHRYLLTPPSRLRQRAQWWDREYMATIQPPPCLSGFDVQLAVAMFPALLTFALYLPSKAAHFSSCLTSILRKELCGKADAVVARKIAARLVGIDLAQAKVSA